jgi:hypothetical protein
MRKSKLEAASRKVISCQFSACSKGWEEIYGGLLSKLRSESDLGARPPWLFWSADEIPFAPGEILVNRDKVSPGNFLDEFGLAEPLLVGAEFQFGHGGKRIHLSGNAADRGDLGDKVREGEEGSAPRLDKHDAAVGSKNALHF